MKQDGKIQISKGGLDMKWYWWVILVMSVGIVTFVIVEIILTMLRWGVIFK